MKPFLTLVISLTATCVFAQERFYAYQKDWSNTSNLKEAAYFMHVVKENDTTYACRYYNISGPMIKMETYSDSALEIPMGLFTWFNEKGKLDSSGFVHKGRKHKRWYYYTHPDSANATVAEEYEFGKFLYRTDYIRKKTSYRDGRTEDLYRAGTGDSSKTFTMVQVEASFPGGVQAWRRYLEKNLRIPDRFEGIIRNGRRTIVVAFMVDPEGNIRDTYIMQSAEWSADMEALRLIRNGPKWIPATQNGKRVNFYQKQAITMVVESD